MYSYGAPPTLPRDGRDDDEDELEDGSFTEDASFIEDGYSVATEASYWEYAVNGFTKTYQEFTEKTHQEFTKAINKFDGSAAIKSKETADIIDDTANWKFPKEHRDVRPLRVADDESGRSGVTNATGYTTATNVTDTTCSTGCTTKSGRSGVTEATATNATGLTDPTHERSEKYTSIEVVYNSEVDRTLGPQVTKKTRECERSVPSNFSKKSSKKSRATQRSSILPTASFEARSLAQTILSDLTITGRPGRYESYITSRFGVTWGNAEKAAAPIAENIPIL